MREQNLENVARARMASGRNPPTGTVKAAKKAPKKKPPIAGRNPPTGKPKN
jgi:hypothetical protein